MLTLSGIVLPSIVLVLLVRRWIAPVPWRIAILFLVLPLAFLHGAVFTSRLPVPVDEVARGDPWRGVVGDVVPRNPLTNDTVRLFLPWMDVVREELFHGRAPLWNRYSFSGYPLLANGESAPFSPIFLGTLFVPLPKQIVAMAGLKIFASLLFTYLFCKREGLGHIASSFAAVVFAFSTFETVFLYYSTVSVTAFLPAALYSLLHAIDRPRKSSVVFVALVVATLLSNGHPESVLHIAIAAAAVLAIELIVTGARRDWLRRFLAPVTGAVAGLALSAPSWIPVLEQVFLSERFAALRSGAHFPAIPGTAAWALIAPNGFGSPVRGNWNWILNYSIVASSYIAFAALALVVAAAISPRSSTCERLRIAAALLFFLVAMGWTPVGRALNDVPPFSIAANDKLRFVVVFLAGVIAARALEERRWLLLAGAAPFGGLLVYVFMAENSRLEAVDLLPLASLAAVVAAPSRLRPMAALLATVVELFALNAGFNALVDAKYFRPGLPLVEELRKRAPAEPFRIVGRDWVFLPNASAQYRLEDVRGSDPMELASYAAFFRRFSVQEPGTDLKRVVDLDREELDFLGVRFALAEPDATLGGRWGLLYRGIDGSLWENRRARPRFFSRVATVDRIRSASPMEFTLRVRADGPAEVVSSQPAAPGWRLYVNGRRVELQTFEGAFLAFRVAAGESAVRLVYRPTSFVVSVAIAILAGILLAIVRGRGIGAGLEGLSAVPAEGRDPSEARQ